jgi:hypothetical protein
MLKTVSTQLALASDTLPEVLAKGNTTGGTDLAVSAGDDITLADNSKVIFGAGSDLQIYSDGSTGQVTGDVNVTGSGTFSNKVGIGTTSPAAANKVQVNLATNTVTTGSPVDSSLFSITGGTPTVGDGVSLQITNLSGAKETGWRISAVTASANNGDLVFNGYAGGSDYPERMRINGSTGALTNVANAYDDFSQTFGNASALPYGIYVSFSGAAPNNNTQVFMTCNDTSGQKFGLKSNGGLANYQANDANLSDEREKNQFGLLDSTSDCVRNWEVVKYLYKDEDQTHPHKYGVIAQQVASHCPEVITNWVKVKGADEVLWVDGDDLPEGVSVGDVKTEAVEQVDRIGVKEQQMFWMLVKSHQEVLDTINTLKARVEALESK